MAKTDIPHNFFERHSEKIATAGPDECWLWTAARDRHGYGRVGAAGGTRFAHRVAFASIHGDGSADGLLVRHRCDVPACVNPAHLEAGTHADNRRDMMDRGRNRAPCIRGERNGSAKLTEADIRTIRGVYVLWHREFGGAALSRRFGVTQQLICQIVKRQIWAHVA